MEPRTGIPAGNRQKVALALSTMLADEFVLYLKTRNAHWNIEGSDFHQMHLFFETQYNELDEIMDEVAERIRMLGHYSPATLSAYQQLTRLSELAREKNNSAGFIEELLGDHESIIENLRAHINVFATEFGDAGTSDFITGLMEKHEKMAWMLRAHFSK